MTLPVNIKDSDSGKVAKVTKFGQLVVAPIAYSIPVTQEMDVIDTAFNFVTPEQGQSIVITDIVIAANKDVSPTEPAIVEVYTADANDSITVITEILLTQIPRSTTVPITGLNLLIGEGVWVNSKTNDNNVSLTIMFYRVPAENV